MQPNPGTSLNFPKLISMKNWNLTHSNPDPNLSPNTPDIGFGHRVRVSVGVTVRVRRVIRHMFYTLD